MHLYLHLQVNWWPVALSLFFEPLTTAYLCADTPECVEVDQGGCDRPMQCVPCSSHEALLTPSWQHLKYRRGQGGQPLQLGQLLSSVEAARWAGLRWEAWRPFPFCSSGQSLAYPLASREPCCLYVCIYSQFPLNPSSKIPLNWTGPTLGVWNVLMLRLALHIWHILSISDNSSRALRKQTDEIHGTVFAFLSGERGAERILWRDLR